jgi:hypothetical protein
MNRRWSRAGSSAGADVNCPSALRRARRRRLSLDDVRFEIAEIRVGFESAARKRSDLPHAFHQFGEGPGSRHAGHALPYGGDFERGRVLRRNRRHQEQREHASQEQCGRGGQGHQLAPTVTEVAAHRWCPAVADATRRSQSRETNGTGLHARSATGCERSTRGHVDRWGPGEQAFQRPPPAVRGLTRDAAQRPSACLGGRLTWFGTASARSLSLRIPPPP